MYGMVIITMHYFSMVYAYFGITFSYISLWLFTSTMLNGEAKVLFHHFPIAVVVIGARQCLYTYFVGKWYLVQQHASKHACSSQVEEEEKLWTKVIWFVDKNSLVCSKNMLQVVGWRSHCWLEHARISVGIVGASGGPINVFTWIYVHDKELCVCNCFY